MSLATCLLLLVSAPLHAACSSASVKFNTTPASATSTTTRNPLTAHNFCDRRGRKQNTIDLTSIMSQCPRCKGQPRSAILYSYGVAGWKDRMYTMNKMFVLAQVLCADLYVPPPRLVLSRSHGCGPNRHCAFTNKRGKGWTWDRYFEGFFLPRENFSADGHRLLGGGYNETSPFDPQALAQNSAQFKEDLSSAVRLASAGTPFAWEMPHKFYFATDLVGSLCAKCGASLMRWQPSALVSETLGQSLGRMGVVGNNFHYVHVRTMEYERPKMVCGYENVETVARYINCMLKGDDWPMLLFTDAAPGPWVSGVLRLIKGRPAFHGDSELARMFKLQGFVDNFLVFWASRVLASRAAETVFMERGCIGKYARCKLNANLTLGNKSRGGA